jgi:hypothetical protein
MWECTCTATALLRCADDVALKTRRTSASPLTSPTVPALARAAPACRRVSLARVCANAMHVAANARPVPTWCCPTTARHLHASGGAARRTCQRTHVQRTLCIATAGVGGGVPDEGGGDGQTLWGKNSSDSPQAPPAAGRDPPRNVTGSVAADSRSVGARSAWGLSSEDKALPLSLLYPYERLPTGDRVRLS